MAHYLDASQLAKACTELGLDDCVTALVQSAQAAGEAIAAKLGIEVSMDASTMEGFGELCVGFGPATEGQELPDELAQYDSSSDWAEASAKLD